MKNPAKVVRLNNRGFAHVVALMVVMVGVATVGSYLIVKSHADSVSGVSNTSGPGSGFNYNTNIFGSALGNVMACKTKDKVKFQASIYASPAKEQFWFDSGTNTVTRHWSTGVYSGGFKIQGTSFNAVIERPTDTAPHTVGVPLSKINKC